MKKLSAFFITIALIFQGVSVVNGSGLEWIEINTIDFSETIESVESLENDSDIKIDKEQIFNGKPTLKCSFEKANLSGGVAIVGVIPKSENVKIGNSYRVRATVYVGTLLNGKYSGNTKIRMGLMAENGKVCGDVVSAKIRDWSEVEFTYTVTGENIGCNKIFIDCGGKENGFVCPKGFNVAKISFDKSCTEFEAESLRVQLEGNWKQFSFDGFENTIANVDVTKKSTHLRTYHSGNSAEKTLGGNGVEPYEGWSCLNSYATQVDAGWAFSHLLPNLTKADIGRKIKVSVYFYVQQLKSGSSDKIGMKLSIASDDEESRNEVSVYAAKGKWVKLEGTFEITEENLNYNKILLCFDNGWNYPMWSRVDNVSVMISEKTQDNESIKLKINGKEAETKKPLRIIDDKLMLPAKETFDALGAGNVVSEDGREIKASFGKYTATFVEGSDTVNVSGQKIHDFIKPVMLNEVLYIPYTAFDIAYKATATWNGLENVVDISTEFPIIRRNVPKSTLTNNSDPYDLHFDEYNPVDVIPWDQLPEADVILSEEDLFKCGKTGAPKYGKFEVVSVEGMPFDKAIRAECTKLPTNSYEFQITPPEFPDAYKGGDILMIELTFRTISVTHEDGEGTITVAVEQNGGSYLKAVSTKVSTGSEWFTVRVPFAEKEPSSPTGYKYCRPKIDFGSKIQTIEVGGFSIVNFKDKMLLEQFDVGTVKKNAVEEIYNKDAQWRKDAIARIEKIRKGDINVVVVDKNGTPIPDADVEVSMFEHEFEWGNATNNTILQTKTLNPEAETAAATLASLFNSIVAETANKWNGYQSGRFTARIFKDYLEKLGIRNMRGHSAIWDKASALPQNVKDIMYDREKLDETIESHFDSLFDDYGDFVDWDIMNEAVGCHVIADIYGKEIYKQWYDWAREKLPENVGLKYNETATGGGTRGVFYKRVKQLLDWGVPLEGVGIQSHLQLGVTEDRIKDLFEPYEDLGLRIKITEFDLNVEDPYLQAGNMRDFMIAAFASPACDGFYMWGYADSAHWLKNAPVLYTSTGLNPENIKPCGQQYIDLVYNKWWTRENGKTDENGKCVIRGYYGDYDITVTKGGATVKTVAKVSKNNEDNTVIVTFK